MRKKYDEIIIKSDLENLVSVQNFIEDICDRYNIYNHFGQLSIAVTEAVENAIRHGNKCNQNKNVRVKSYKSQNGISFKISDEGKGFNYEKFNDLAETSGKGDGIFLMRSLSNNLQFSDKGKTIELNFFVEGIDSSKALERGALMAKYLTRSAVVQHQN